MADRVRIYRNLHKGSLSIKDWDRQSPTYGRVIDRPNVYFVSHPRFIVSKAGRDRVLREKRKNVHAYVQGHPVDLDSDKVENATNGREVYYNPYNNDTFVDSKGEPIHKADWAYIEAFKDRYTIYAGVANTCDL